MASDAFLGAVKSMANGRLIGTIANHQDAVAALLVFCRLDWLTQASSRKGIKCFNSS